LNCGEIGEVVIKNFVSVHGIFLFSFVITHVAQESLFGRPARHNMIVPVEFKKPVNILGFSA
jgi:hypothetical protein